MPQLSTRFRPVRLLAALSLTVGLVLLPGAMIAKSPNAAVVVKSGTCTLYDGTGTLVDGQNYHAVINRRVTKVTCRAKALANPTGTAVRFNFANKGVPCNTPSGPTNRWRETVSANGNARITCLIKNA
jgi:hypothetical protein